MTGEAVIVGVDATAAGALAAVTGRTVARAAGVPCRVVHVTPARSAALRGGEPAQLRVDEAETKNITMNSLKDSTSTKKNPEIV